MNTCSGVRSSRPAGFFSFGRPAASPARRRAQTWRSLVIAPCALDGLQVRLRRPYGRETPAGFSLKRLATAFMNNPGQLMRAQYFRVQAQLPGITCTHFDCPYLNTHVELTGEREAHIQEKHPDLLPAHRDYVSETVRDPDEVRRDPRFTNSLLVS